MSSWSLLQLLHVLQFLFWRWSLSNDDDPLPQRKHELLDKSHFGADPQWKSLGWGMDTAKINCIRHPTNHDEFSCSAQFHNCTRTFYGKNKLPTTWTKHDAFCSWAKKVFYDRPAIGIAIAIGAMINDALINPFFTNLQQTRKSIPICRVRSFQFLQIHIPISIEIYRFLIVYCRRGQFLLHFKQQSTFFCGFLP